MSTATHSPPPPRLTLLDTMAGVAMPTTIEFQYSPLDMTENVGSNYASTPGMNRPHPLLQFNHGVQESFSFTAELFAQSQLDNIQDQLDALKTGTRRDDALGRPPRWQFTWGSIIDETVVIESIGEIKYGEIRSDGSARRAQCGIKLLVYATIDVDLVAEDRPSDTFYKATKIDEQWEDIANNEYGDPLLGDILRGLNPNTPFPGTTTGKIVKLPKLATIRNTTVTPTSTPLQRTDAGMKLRSRVYEARSVSRQSTVVKS